MSEERHALRAYAFADPIVPIVPAPRRRAWMDSAKDHWPNRCLPLLIANETGWVMLNTHPFRATWDGGQSGAAVTIEFPGEEPTPVPVSSHFGMGIITFRVPFIFRTPPGWNLLARGPANLPKDGISALEGVVETDWSYANFTMNWQITRPGTTIEFVEGEPFCMIVPQRRGELESFTPEILDLSADPRMEDEFERFGAAREELQIQKFLAEFSREYQSYRKAWEGSYYRGRTPSGEAAPEHVTKVHLAPFEDRRPVPSGEGSA
jgi:hypothetical protein